MVELYQHQKIALSYLRSNDYFALFMEQGTGKTLPVLMRLLELFRYHNANSALIVAPKSALGAWERDISLFDPLDQVVLKQSITLINYDKVWRKGTNSPYWRKYDAIVLDEAHCIKNKTSRRAKFLLSIGELARYRYILTGTPISNGQLENIWSLYCFLSPYTYRGNVYSNIFKRYMEANCNGKYRGSYYEFQQRYCILNQYYQPSSYINVSELQSIINTYCYRVRKVDCLDLPEKLPDEIVKVTLPTPTKQLYNKLRDSSAIVEYDILAENPLSRLLKLRQLSSGFLTVNPDYIDDKSQLTDDNILPVDCEKIQTLSELIDGYEDTKKLVVFAEFKQSIRQIAALLQRRKINHVILDGEQKDKQIWRKFQTDEDVRVIVCQYQTANAGIDLFASDTIIYYEPTLRSQILEQSRDRIHRPGQTNKCSYIHILTSGTVEMDIYRATTGYADFSIKLFQEYMDKYSKKYG